MSTPDLLHLAAGGFLYLQAVLLARSGFGNTPKPALLYLWCLFAVLQAAAVLAFEYFAGNALLLSPAFAMTAALVAAAVFLINVGRPVKGQAFLYAVACLVLAGAISIAGTIARVHWGWAGISLP